MTAKSWLGVPGKAKAFLVRKMLTEAVKKRFGTVESVFSRRMLKLLSNNGGAYIAVQTRQMNRSPELKPINTPVCSQLSNSMLENLRPHVSP